MSESTPIPSGVEILFGGESEEVKGRIAYLRHTDTRPIEERMPELRRLVAAEANAELRRIGVIR